MSYFESITTATGLNKVSNNPFRLLDFQYLILPDGETFQGDAGDREILAVILGGRGIFSVNDCVFKTLGKRSNVFDGKPHSVYISCGSRYSITAAGRLDIALVSAPSDMRAEPYVIEPEKVAAGTWGAANFKRSFHQILTLARRLIVGETYTLPGNWSTFPPHKHEKDDLPREAYHEELYFFKVSPADGFGLTRYYNSEVDTGYVVRDHTILMAPNGFHTLVSAPGYTTYYLWALAGVQRIQATVDDPSIAWVARMVPTLKSLGH